MTLNKGAMKAMTRVVKMAPAITVHKISYQKVVSIDLSDVSVAEWCLNLCLLKENLTDELLFPGVIKLRIGVNEFLEKSERAKVTISPNEILLSVHPEELEYWLVFFLKYFRDGVAEVDHIDVEASTNSVQPEEVYLVFQVKDVTPPMSAEEARKIIDSYD